jgi:hypothetical protein
MRRPFSMAQAPHVFSCHTDIEIVRGAGLVLMGESDYDGLIEFLARNYLKGEIIAGSGGVRKIRYAKQGMGKRAGSA